MDAFLEFAVRAGGANGLFSCPICRPYQPNGDALRVHLRNYHQNEMAEVFGMYSAELVRVVSLQVQRMYRKFRFEQERRGRYVIYSPESNVDVRVYRCTECPESNVDVNVIEGHFMNTHAAVYKQEFEAFVTAEG